MTCIKPWRILRFIYLWFIKKWYLLSACSSNYLFEATQFTHFLHTDLDLGTYIEIRAEPRHMFRGGWCADVCTRELVVVEEEVGVPGRLGLR